MKKSNDRYFLVAKESRVGTMSRRQGCQPIKLREIALYLPGQFIMCYTTRFTQILTHLLTLVSLDNHGFAQRNHDHTPVIQHHSSHFQKKSFDINLCAAKMCNKQHKNTQACFNVVWIDPKFIGLEVYCFI